MKASSPALARSGICIACGCLVQQHFHPFTNAMRGCAYALRLNEQLRQSRPQPALQPERRLQIIDGGRNRERQAEVP